MPKDNANHFIAILGYILVILLVFGFSLFPGTTHLLFGDDIHYQHSPWQTYTASRVRGGIFPWWNPYVFSGSPHAANPQISSFYPFNWIFLITSVPSTWTYSVYVALHLLIAMTGMYWLVRHFSRQTISAWIAGCVFGLSGFFTARIALGHIGIIASASYVPAIFGMYWRSMKDRRYVVGAGVLLAMSFIAGYQIMTLYAGWALGFGAVTLTVVRRSLQPFRNLFFIFLIGLGLASVQLIPSIEYAMRSIRSYEPPSYEWISYGAHTVNNLKELVWPFAYGNHTIYTASPPNYGEHAAYVGRLSLVLIALSLVAFTSTVVSSVRSKYFGLFTFRTGRELTAPAIFVFFLTMVFGLWVSMANNAPLDIQKFLWRYVPIYKTLRIPPRHLLLFVFGASALTGLGASLIRSKKVRFIALAIILIDLVMYARFFIYVKEIPKLRHDIQLITILVKDTSLYRMLPNFGAWVQPRDSLDFNSVSTYGIFSVTGYDPMILRNYYDFIDAVNRSTQPSILTHDIQIPYFIDLSSQYINYLNIRYYLIPFAYDVFGGSSTPQFTLLREDSARDYRLYQNNFVYPRFFLTPSITVLPNREAVAAAVREGRTDPRATILVDREHIAQKNIREADCPAGTVFPRVEVLSYGTNTIRLKTSSPCSAYLSTSEVFYPGWDASIDGVKAPLFEGNMAFRALWVPKGDHIIELFYVPRIFYLGGSVTLLTALVCGIFFRKYRK